MKAVRKYLTRKACHKGAHGLTGDVTSGLPQLTAITVTQEANQKTADEKNNKKYTKLHHKITQSPHDRNY